MLKQWCAKMAEKLGECASAGQKADMLKYYNCTTFDIMADLCFNESLHMLEDGEYSPWVKTIFDGIRALTPFRAIKLLGKPIEQFVDEVVLKMKPVRRAAHQHWRYCADRVDKRLARTPERVDLWSKIIEKSVGPEAFSLDEHHATAVVFMGAGTETSATALSGITYYLLQNPECMERLCKEIRSAFRDIDDITLDGLRRLEYLQAVINEGLRMYPPVPIALPRVIPQGGAVINGDFVPAGAKVAVHHLATYRSRDNFQDPFAFHPERWLGDDQFKDDHLDALEPFSLGPRNCLGKNLAWHEIRLLLTTAFLHFDLSLCEESEKWTDQKVHLLWEKKPLMCTLTEVKRQGRGDEL